MKKTVLSLCVAASLLTVLDAEAGVVQEQQAQIDDLIARVETLEASNSALQSMLYGVSRSGDTLVFEGMNLQIVNGLGETDGVPDGEINDDSSVVNGLGNLVIGYDEPRDSDGDKSGSHNLVLGSGSNYSSFGGVVAGYYNGSSAPFATAIGGAGNNSSGSGAAIFGGFSNFATELWSTAVGGELNWATGVFSLVGGGYHNEANGVNGSALGGSFNLSSNGDSMVVGGSHNVASGGHAVVSGGDYNTASGMGASVSGGRENTASGGLSTVSGGWQRTVDSSYDWRAGSLFEDQ